MDSQNGSASCPVSEEKRSLLKWTQVPIHLKFNPYILQGYRPLMSFSGCLYSLTYFHNETINILTHGLPALYILIYGSSLLPWDQIQVPILRYTHIIGIISPWVGSFIYHTFMNHRAGSPIYRRLLQLDMLGIWVIQSFGALTTVISASYCFNRCCQISLLFLYSVTCIWGLYKACLAGFKGSPWDRRLCFLIPVLIRLILAGLRTAGLASGHPDSVTHVWLQDVWAIIGGIVGALRIPEKWFPGRFDYFFNSHHIMHVLVVVAVVHMHYAAKLDLIWLSNASCSQQDLLSDHIHQEH